MRLWFAIAALMLLTGISSITSLAMEQQPSDYLRKKEDGGSVDYYYVENSDKDGSIVAARVASAVFGVSETRTLDINSNQNLIGPEFLRRRCEQTCRHYREAGLDNNNPLLKTQNIVMGSVHELGLYLAECLHAPMLPLQYIGFAESWQRIDDTPALKIVMSDYGVADKFWVWCKMSKQAHVPKAYCDMLANAQNLFLVRSTEVETRQDYVGQYRGSYIHSSTVNIGHNVIADIVAQLPVEVLPDSTRLALRQHEWGLPDETIATMKDIWVKVLRKKARNFHVIEGDTVQLFRSIPTFWERYLIANRRQVEGVTFNAYWVAHPTLERRYNLIPFHFYRFKNAAQEWTPYDGQIKSIILNHWANASPFIVRSFVNNIGSGPGPASDVEELHSFLVANNLASDNPNINPYFCVGMDCTGFVCTGYDVEPLDDIPSTAARTWMRDRLGDTLDRRMSPLVIAVVVAVARSMSVLKMP